MVGVKTRVEVIGHGRLNVGSRDRPTRYRPTALIAEVAKSAAGAQSGPPPFCAVRGVCCQRQLSAER